MRKKTFFGGLVALLLIGGFVALIVAWQFLGGAVMEDADLYVSRRDHYAAVTDSLSAKISHRRAFSIYAAYCHLDQNFKPGHYRLQSGMSVVQIARMLQLGLQTPVKVRINNVRIPAQLAQKLARQIDADSTQILSALTSRELAAEVGFDSLTLFSMFLPNTYEFYWTVTPEEFVRRMKQEYDRFWTDERDAKRQRSGLSRLEVMTLASIVTEETNQSDEMARVAGVYINRLRIGMPLQADPTIKYALQDFGLRRILHRHLKTPSPYNTYINKGLPPTPICMPNLRAVEAVLDYETHGYLYFCARPSFDGHHNFARTYSEHQANARAYSAALNRRNIR